jgi:hypothetical protein
LRLREPAYDVADLVAALRIRDELSQLDALVQPVKAYFESLKAQLLLIER